MAANLNALQMGGGAGNVRRQPQNQQLSSILYSQIIQQQPASGWQTTVPPQLRVSNAMNIITNSVLAMPQNDNSQAVSMGVAYEREAFAQSPDKTTYEQRVASRINDLFKKRQANEQTIHNSLNAQAAAQAQAQTQAQMMMSQNMQMRGMGQPLPQGLQNPQQQVQPPPINQQGQLNMGVAHPNNLAMNSGNPQMMQMGGQMRPQMPGTNPMAGLSPQDQVKVSNLAHSQVSQMPESQRTQSRIILQNRLGRELLARLQQENIDPLVYCIQNQIIRSMRTQQAAANPAGMAMQAHQNRSMNQPGQQLQGVPNAPFSPFSNVEIMNQQKAGLMAQEAGQMVVPASSVAGRNATSQTLGPSPGPNQGAGQSAMPHQLQHQQFNQPQPVPQQIKLEQRAADQKAAKSQAEIRAQAQAKLMQGQPGGLNGPGAVSQSPAMNTLNAPVRRPPMVGAQADGHPPMGQGNVPFGQPMMDPRFNQIGQRPPVGPNANINRTQMLNNLIQQMPPETQQHILSLPPDKVPEMIMKWNASRRSVQMPGQPQPQPGHIGPGGNPVGQPMGQFSPGNNNVGQQPNLGMPMNQQSQLLMQQQLNKLRNPNGLQQGADRNAVMDNMNVPVKILESLRTSSNGGLPPELKKWGQLKHWMTQNNVPRPNVQHLLSIQSVQFQSFLKTQAPHAANHQGPQPNMQQQGIHTNGQVTPQMGQPAPNMAGANPMITVTPQELQSAKNYDKFKNWPDDKIHQWLMQMKIQAMKSRMHVGGPQPQPSQPKPTQAQATPAQGLQPQAPQVSQPGSMPAAPAPQPATVAVPQQRQQNAVPEPNSANPPAPQNRNNKQPQNNRAPLNVPTAPTPKLGTKRRSSDDVAEIPNPSSAPVQRPTSQQAQPVASAPSQGQGSFPNPEQLATLNPEQRQKYEAMVKSRQIGNQQIAEGIARLKAISQDQHDLAKKEQLPDIPMTPEQYQDTAQKIQALYNETTKISKILGRWYALTRDDGRAKLFFKMRLRLIKQYVDGDKLTILRDKFSILPTDLDKMRTMLETMATDVANHFPQSMRKNLSQQNASETAVPPATPAPQLTPLSAANLEKQTQALSKGHQKSNSRAGQPPVAPTTTRFGAQSPDGQPTYAGKPAVTQDNLQLPPRKKARTGAASNMNGSSANASPQVQKLSSPEMSKRPATSEAKQVAAKPQFHCTEQGCESQSIGFPTEKAQLKHMEDEHIKPAENPLKFASENLADALGLDANGKLKKTAAAGSNVQSPGDVSKQQSQASPGPARPDLANPRGSPMGRQGSTAGPKPNELIKSIAGKTGTPKPDANLVLTTNGSTGLQAASYEAMGSTIDPDLLRIPGLDVGGGGAISDMNLYRSITPNLTPESAKDSASSEPNSDVSEGVALNLTLDVGFEQWDPFTGQNLDADTDFNLDPNDLTGIRYPSFTSWDEVNPDFDKPFTLDTSLWSLDVS